MENCSICLESLEKRDIKYSFPCFHSYHEKCLENLKEKHGYCALCRASIKIIINKDSLAFLLTPAINLNIVYSLPDITENLHEKLSKLSTD